MRHGAARREQERSRKMHARREKHCKLKRLSTEYCTYLSQGGSAGDENVGLCLWVCRLKRREAMITYLEEEENRKKTRTWDV
jgi:hypothetical protein